MNRKINVYKGLKIFRRLRRVYNRKIIAVNQFCRVVSNFELSNYSNFNILNSVSKDYNPALILFLVKPEVSPVAQYVFTMNGVGKVVPPNKQILKDIYLNFFPGAKIGVLGYNGAGKSTLLRIMAGIDTDIIGEARPQPDLKIGFLAQEPELDESKDVRGNVEDGMADIKDAQKQLDAVYAAYAEPDADFDALASEQARLEKYHSGCRCP